MTPGAGVTTVRMLAGRAERRLRVCCAVAAIREPCHAEGPGGNRPPGILAPIPRGSGSSQREWV
jgi:hypothetical protein